MGGQLNKWPPPAPSVERSELRRRLWLAERERDQYRRLAEVALAHTELIQRLTMTGYERVTDVQQGAAWEQQRAVERLTAIMQNFAADAGELPAAMSDLIAAAASAAATQSASAIVTFVERLNQVEERVTQIREDLADIKTLVRDIDDRLKP